MLLENASLQDKLLLTATNAVNHTDVLDSNTHGFEAVNRNRTPDRPTPEPMDQTRVLAAALRAARKRKKLSQRDVARLIGRDLRRVFEMESGEHDPRLSSVAMLARVLELRLVLVPEEMQDRVMAMIGAAPAAPAGGAAVTSVFDDLFVPDPVAEDDPHGA